MCYGLNFWNRCVLTDSAAFLCSMHSVSDMSDSAFIHACFHYTHPKCEENGGVMITYNIYIVIRETGQFSSKGIINDFIGNLNRLTVSRRFTEQAV